MTTYHRTTDGQQVADAEALDARGILRPGYSMRSRLQFMDGAPAPMTDEQRQAMRDAERARLSNAWRDPSAPFRHDAASAQDAGIGDPYERYDRMIQDAWKQP
ncbi:hypothetical protein H8A97_37950 [Bradyrhizobium sp. Arg62]|uniref:hypothetical protein n=1 Tax=Bradyrhizobium brasilense TaxID=1419277 RepID=UPI001E5B092C|nr:hypothetical protein [Bradyrhizobium brasilense]MCC8950695.1 hypothetical protein [Bradyrhizobium brasilense]